jgi:hypothetical protein
LATILCLPGVAHAEQGLDALPPDIDESALQWEIAQFINEHQYTPATGLTASDIDLLLTVKLYNGPELFSGDVLNFAVVKEQLENERYMMLIIQMYFGGDTYQAEIVKGEPVDYSKIVEGTSDEWIALQESRVGKWYVQTVGYSEGVQPDYIKVAAERTGIYDREPILVKGLPHFHYPVAIYPNDEGNLGTMTVIHPATAPWEVLGIERPSEDAEFVFDYEYIKEKVNSLPPDGGSAGEVSSDVSEVNTAPPSTPPELSDPVRTDATSPDSSKLTRWIVFTGVVLACAIIAIIVIRRRQINKRRSTKKQDDR